MSETPEPEPTAPIQNPWTSPSARPSDPARAVPPPTPYPVYEAPPATPPVPEPGWGAPAQVPYAEPQPGGYPQAGYPPVGYPPVGYGQPGCGAYAPQPYLYAGANHGRAATALWLGVTGIVGALLTPFCCITLPLLVCSPIAWVLGASARKQIDAVPPGTFGNRGQAQAGFVLGIIGSVLAMFSILGLVALGAAIGMSR